MTDVIHVYNHPPKAKKEADHPSKFDRWYDANKKTADAQKVEHLGPGSRIFIDGKWLIVRRISVVGDTVLIATNVGEIKKKVGDLVPTMDGNIHLNQSEARNRGFEKDDKDASPKEEAELIAKLLSGVKSVGGTPVTGNLSKSNIEKGASIRERLAKLQGKGDAVAVPARAQFQSLVRSHIAVAEQEYAQAQATLKQLPDSSWLRQKVVEARHKLERLKESGDAVMKDCEGYDETKDGPIANWLAAHGFAFAGNHGDHAEDVSDSAVTIFQARDVLQRRGMIIYKKNEAFAVNFKDGHSTSVYQANDLEEATLAGLSMAKQKLGVKSFRGKTKDDFFLDRFGSKIIWSQAGQDRLNALLAPMRKTVGKTVKDAVTPQQQAAVKKAQARYEELEKIPLEALRKKALATGRGGDLEDAPRNVLITAVLLNEFSVPIVKAVTGDSKAFKDAKPATIVIEGGKWYYRVEGDPTRLRRSALKFGPFGSASEAAEAARSKGYNPGEPTGGVFKDAHTGPTRMQIQEYYTNAERSGGSKAVARAKTEKAFELYDLKIDNKGQVIGYAFKQEGMREDHAKDAKTKDHEVVETHKGFSIVKVDKRLAGAGAYRIEKDGVVFGYYPSTNEAKEAVDKYRVPKTPRKPLR